MEWSLSGNALKTFGRSITCLARIGNELTLQASPQQLALHALNSSRSAYQSITLKPAFFDTYTITGAQVQCSVLLKAVCSLLRTPLTSIDHLTVILTDPDASKVQWTLDCYNGELLSVFFLVVGCCYVTSSEKMILGVKLLFIVVVF
ncbi:cell cycle checkpoint control protein RAD9A [Tanacetum coccineum]